MTTLTLRTGLAQAGHRHGVTVAVLEYSQGELAVFVGAKTAKSIPSRTRVWAHTVFELGDLAAALRFVALDELPKFYGVPAHIREAGLGSARIRPALWLEIGRATFDGWATMLYCRKTHRLAMRNHIYVELVGATRNTHAFLETEEVLAFSDAVAALARIVADIVDWKAGAAPGRTII